MKLKQVLTNQKIWTQPAPWQRKEYILLWQKLQAFFPVYKTFNAVLVDVIDMESGLMQWLHAVGWNKESIARVVIASTLCFI